MRGSTQAGHPAGHESVGGFCGVCGVVWPCSAMRRVFLGLGTPEPAPPKVDPARAARAPLASAPGAPVRIAGRPVTGRRTT